ncbi:MAG: NAD(P)H-quinone oxidoreductase [Methyloligellaceae bacterium]
MAMIQTEMTAIGIARPGGPEVLEARTLPVPEPGPGQLLVKVAAAGVNRPDVLQRVGIYPPPKGASEIPGLEIAGRVVAAGPDTGRFAAGDSVCALVSGGGYAEFCLADELAILPVPNGLGLEEAAALPETFFTVWHNVFERGALAAGEWLLVHGGSSGIGTTAIQLAAALGANVIVTAGSQEKCTACEELGAARAINYNEEDFVEVVKSTTGGHGADVILDMVGGSYIERNFKAAAPDGRIVQIAFLGGARAEVDFTRLMLKRLTFTGSTLRARPLAVKGAIAEALAKRIWPLLEAGKVKPVIDATFPLADASEAHRHMESSAHIGKIVLTT